MSIILGSSQLKQFLMRHNLTVYDWDNAKRPPALFCWAKREQAQP